MSIEEDRKRYLAACHAMQSGVEFHPDKSDQTPKHLRVGVNVALRDLGSLTALLIARGVISEAELVKALADGMEEEAADHARRVSEAMGGANITLA